MADLLKKIICRILAPLCAAAALLPVASLSASAARPYPEYKENIGFYDIQGVVDDEDEAELTALIREAADEIDMYVAVVIIGPETPLTFDSEVIAYADQLYTDMFNSGPVGVEEDTDGILLLINNATKYDFITTSGIGQIYFSNDPDNDRINMIFDDIWDAMLDGNYKRVVRDFCDSICYYYDKGYSHSDYVYEPGKGYGMIENGVLVWKDAPPKDYTVWLFVSLCCAGAGLITAICVYFGVQSSYKFKKSLNPTNYICNSESVMHESSDNFLREYTSKVRIQSSSSSGGGGRSGGGRSRSSGGRSRGGGGRRR